jgi:Mn-containing catalase
VIRDLRANIAAEAGALNTYEQLIAITTDDGTRDALRHLATREVSHTHMFMEALRALNALDQPLFGDLKPDDTVNLYFNLSSGPGADERGPWNREPTFQYVADPLQNAMQEHGGRTKGSNEMTPPARTNETPLLVRISRHSKNITRLWQVPPEVFGVLSIRQCFPTCCVGLPKRNRRSG